MIRGVHAMFYSSDAPVLRRFFRDKLGLACTDVGAGWLIFDLPEAEVGCHESKTDAGVVPAGKHEIFFYCDDIEQTVADLKKRGVEFTAGIADRGWGRITRFRAPGDAEIELYEPKYTTKPRRAAVSRPRRRASKSNRA